MEIRGIPLQQEPFVLTRYSSGATVVSQSGKIGIIATPAGYGGRSAGGVVLGSTEKDLAAGYGSPSRVLDLSQWKSWVYAERQIAFQVQGGKVISWMIFLE